MIIDTSATEPPRNWFLDIARASTEDLLLHATTVRAKLAYARDRGHVVDARAYELRLLDLERAIAIHNRRATEAEDQRQAEQRVQREADLREAYLRGWIGGRNSLTVGDCGAGPCLVEVEGADADASAAEWARGKVGG